MKNQYQIEQNRTLSCPRCVMGGAQASKIDFRSILGANMMPSWVQVGSKLGKVGAKLASESTLEGSQGRFGWDPDLQDRFLIDFGTQHGAKLGPSWPQNRIHKGMFFRSSFWTGCWSLLGSILDTFSGPKWSPKVI